MEFVLPHPDGRIRPDRHEPDVVGNVVGNAGGHIGQAESPGVAANEVESAFVYVHGPHRGTRGFHRKAEGDGAPTASQIEKVAAGRRWGRMGEQNLGARIDSVGGEDSVCGRKLHFGARECDLDWPKLQRAGRS